MKTLIYSKINFSLYEIKKKNLFPLKATGLSIAMVLDQIRF